MSVVKPNQSNYPSQSQQTQITQWTNQNSKQVHVTGVKRGKNACKRELSRDWLVWVLLLIGRESGAKGFKPITERNKAKPKQNTNYFRHSIENRSKTTLLVHLNCK